jgi:hypothetical protein
MPPEINDEVIDRGDDLIPPVKEDTSAADLEKVKNDPAVKDLEADLTSEKDEEKDHKKDSRIPLARHKEILEKEREQRATLERQLAQYQQGGQIADMNAELTAAENEIVKMDKEYRSLLVEGELDKAGEKMDAIRKAERQIAETKSDMKIHAAEIRATERARYNTALERIETAFPTLNPDHEAYDEAAMTEVVELKEAYQLKGLTPTAALQKAVKLIVEPRTTRQEVATTTKPNVTEKDVAAERKKEAVGKTVAAVSKTPPSLSRTGLDSDKLGGGELSPEAVMKMSQKEFAGLSEATLAKMRGDEL